MSTIFDKALEYLARREHSEQELSQKLSLKFPNQTETIAITLEQLKRKKYLNNNRFIEGRVRHRLAQGYGPNKIIAELTQMHGIDAEEIKPYLSAPEEQSSTVKLLIAKKFAQLDLQDWQARNKVIAYCLRRGFPLQEIRAALRADD